MLSIENNFTNKKANYDFKKIITIVIAILAGFLFLMAINKMIGKFT